MRHRWIAVLTLVACAGLGFAACKSNEVNQTSNTVNNFTSVGPSGGEVSGPDGTKVIIPAGALSASTDIGILVANAGEYSAMPTEMTAAGKVYAFHPHGQFFAIDPTIFLPAPAGTHEVWRAQKDGSWSLHTKATASGGFVQFRTSGFSFYAVGAPTTISDAGEDVLVDSADDSGDTAKLCPRPPATGKPVGSASITGTWGGKTIAALDVYEEGFGASTTNPDSGLPEFLVQHTIHFVPYANACGHVEEGLERANTEQFVIAVSATAGTSADAKVTPGTYSMGTATTDAGTRVVSADATLVPIDAECKGTYSYPDVTGTITIEQVTPTFKGSFTITSPYALSGTFDAPPCYGTMDCCLK